MFALPKKRPLFVLDEGGGGFWICDAVGAREERIEYVLCMIGCSVWVSAKKVCVRVANSNTFVG